MAAPNRRLTLLVALASAALFGGAPSIAQPVLDLALNDAQVAVAKGCAILTVNFNIRIRYAHHFPLDHGDELRITVNFIDRDRAAALLARMKREATRAPNGKLAAIKAIVFETDQIGGPVLRIQFDHPVFYQVAPNSDTQSLVVAIAGKKPLASCKPSLPDSDVAAIGATRIKDRPVGKISDADLRKAAGWMDEGRAALRKSNYDGAIGLFAKVLKYPENQYSPEAQELLGLARQKKGQHAEARAEYEDYLRRYPANEGSLRVGQRLAGLITANGDPAGPLRALNGQPPPGPAKAGVLLQPRETTWTFSGSASEFYVRNDSFNTVRDPSIAPDPTADPDSHRVHQNELLSSLDAVATWNNDQTKGKIRFSGSEEHSFNSDTNDLYGVAMLFVDAQVKDWNLRTVIGRQTLNTDGVLGRFDGALLSWQALPWIRFDLVGGSPVVSRFDLPFKDERYFYGGSVTFGQFFGGLDTTIYAIEQRDRWLVDREAVGAEFRYFQQDKFIFGTLDYDTNFNRLNAAIFSGSWTLPDKSTIYGGADYRKTPYLSTWNALLNQPFTTLYDMLRLEANEPLQQLALDQTPTYESAMLGFSHPLSDKFQISADATVVNLTQPITFVGLDPSLATLPAGNEYYYSTQLIGSNLFTLGDMYIAALHYSQMATSKIYAADFNMRYPLTNDFRLSPRLRLAYQTGNGIDLTEYTILPSVLLDYYWDKNLNFELEVGTQWTRSKQAGVQSTDTELFITVGLRYDFYADDTAKRAGDERRCGTPGATALCRYLPAPQGSNCASTPGACPR